MSHSKNRSKKTFLCLSFFLSFWSTLSLAAAPISQIPAWQLERGGQISYIIGTPPIYPTLKKLPPFYREIIGSKPKFLSEIVDSSNEKLSTLIRDHVQGILTGHNRALSDYLPPEQVKFIRQTFRRLALTNTSRLKQIFIPGYAGVIGEGSAAMSVFLPPLIAANCMISAATGVGLGMGRTIDEALLDTAKRTNREIIPLRNTLDVGLLMNLVGPRQVKEVVDYIQTQQERNQPVILNTALEKMYSTLDRDGINEIAHRSIQDLNDNVDLIVSAHENGGTVAALSLLEIFLHPSGRGIFDRLSRVGFKITRIQDLRIGGGQQGFDSCARLLE